jgi:two-component system CheB/CheR fusion protein
VFSDPPFSRMDLISCRNVLIYLSPVLQKRVIPIFHYALKPSGFLVVGNTEGLVGSGSEIFDLVDRKTKVYQKKAVPSPVTFGLSLGAHEAPEIREKPMHVVREQEKAKTPVDVQREADRLLLTKYVPSAVVVDEDMDILQSRGSTSRYLELPVGKVSLNLFKMARQGLLYELRALMEQARQKSVAVSKDDVSMDDGKTPALVKLEVIPFRTPARDRQHFLVLFEEKDVEDGGGTRPVKPPPKASSKGGDADSKEVQVSQLKQELAATKEYLQSIIEGQEASNEELQSANEEIQSGNEELQSTNEELQTSKEELESANEELNTVNEEIQHRNQQLSQLSNDLINLLNSCTIPMLLLGEDLRIRRYTPEAEKVLGFSGNDVGKPLTNVRLSVDVPQLERWMLDVMRDITSRSERIQLRDKWYKLRLTPYRTLENKIDGVVLALMDVSDLVQRNGPKKSRKEKR